MTAGELARRARVTGGFISQLEHSKTLPSLQTLTRVATALDVPLTYLLLEDDGAPQVRRRHERPALAHEPGSTQTTGLASTAPHHLTLITFELPSGAISEGLTPRHPSQQCYLVLQGTVRAFYGEARYLLNAGDSIVWDGTLPYRLENVGEQTAHLVLALAPAGCAPAELADVLPQQQLKEA